MQLISIIGLAAAVAVAKPTVYFIRHGEKPDDGNGLSAMGMQRAQCLRSVFGADSGYNIDYIMAQRPKSNGHRQRPLDTVKPLAGDLGLDVDISCDRDDPKCVKKAVKDYNGNGNILICWEHKVLTDLAEELGADNAGDYPKDHFDLIWVDKYPYDEINEIQTENCPGLSCLPEIALGLNQKHLAGLDEVDIIVAGGGTAGCIVASRLASADPKLSILVIEGGMNNFEDPTVVNIGLFFSHIMPGSKTTLFHPARASKHIAGRALAIPCGSVLSGGSSINMAMYSRAQRSDFDAWNMPGWATDDMIPYMRKLETYHGKGDGDLHGHDGPVHISRGLWSGRASENDFISPAAKAGYPEVDDEHTMNAINCFGRAIRYVSTDGRRQDTAHTYLHPRLQDGKHPNLHVVLESQVIRVSVADGRATGVVFRPNPKFHPDDAAEVTVRARKLVVVSCGALGTPAVLERSGIGRPEILAKAGVTVLAENEGVGAGYEDHQLMTSAYKTNLGSRDTVSDVLFGLLSPEMIVTERPEILGYNGQDATGKLRPTDKEAASLGPEFEAAWNADFKSKPDKPLVCMTMLNYLPGFPEEGVDSGQYLGLSSFLLYPYSRGHVHITGPSLDDVLDFDTGFLNDEQGLDIKQHVWAYKKQREIMRRMDCFRGESRPWHPAFSDNSTAAVIETEASLPDGLPHVTYTEEDDEAIADFVRIRVQATWHSMGTCKMKPREQGGVVDAALSVYGVEGLKIADLSITPNNIGGNMNNTAMVIGERAADIIISELGLGV